MSAPSLKRTPEQRADAMAEAVWAPIETVANALVERIRDLEKQVAELSQQKAGVVWTGVFKEGRGYQPGDLTTRSGSLWLCTSRTSLAPGTCPDTWTLICKGGRPR
jgi:hypothetical protein